jgi:hypothetical protein
VLPLYEPSHLLARLVHTCLNFIAEDGDNGSSETLVHIRTTWCYIPEDGNFHGLIGLQSDIQLRKYAT